MKMIPTPMPGCATWIDTFGFADLDNMKSLRELGYANDEAGLLLALLRADVNYDADPDGADHERDAALQNIRNLAPHLIEAAKQEPPHAKP